MTKGRLEAFSDGVIAILITITMLDLRTPLGAGLRALRPQLAVLLAYALSFTNLGIYWNNHHHLMHAVERVNGRVLWANLHLLFWLSLVPLATNWIGAYPAAHAPTAIYGAVLLLAAVAYTILVRTLLAANGPRSRLAEAIGRDWKGTVSLLLYVAAIGFALWRAAAADVVYVGVALLWLIPDRRIEGRL